MQFNDVIAGDVRVEIDEYFPDGAPRSGVLIWNGRRTPIRDGVPRFIDGGNYADNFGLQWTTYQRTQFDSATGLPLTARRFWGSTRWRPEELRGRLVLEAGSGAGRFTEILLAAGARVVSCDLSQAVNANFANNRGKGDLRVCQADLYDLPFADERFDFVFCYGVLQHLPDPATAFANLFGKLKPGGRISVDYYEKLSAPSPWSTPKYYWRPLTRRAPPAELLRLIRLYAPRLLPLDTAIRKSGPLGELVAACLRLPCWNYHFLPLPAAQKAEWAVMDTFDAMGARYDEPMTVEEVRRLVSLPDAVEAQVFHGSNGVVANVRRRLAAEDAPRRMTLAEALTEAVRLHRDGRLGEAESLYRTILAHQPQEISTRANLGLLLSQRGLIAEALEHLTAAAAHPSANSGVLSAYAQVLASVGRTDEAEKVRSRADALASSGGV